jgi:hypothetical protein
LYRFPHQTQNRIFETQRKIEIQKKHGKKKRIQRKTQNMKTKWKISEKQAESIISDVGDTHIRCFQGNQT